MALKLGKPIFYAVAAVGLVWQAYILLGWSLIALLATSLFATRPGVTHHWLYYILGFAECVAPVMYMVSFNYDPKIAPPDKGQDLRSLAILVLAGGGFIAFALVPHLTTPWLWLARLLWFKFSSPATGLLQ